MSDFRQLGSVLEIFTAIFAFFMELGKKRLDFI